MPKYLTIHEETNMDRVLLESRWTEISQDLRAEWEMTLFNMHQGKRYCEWTAPNAEVIEDVFRESGIKWSEIIEVEETAADKWRVWEARTRKSMLNCWEVNNCNKEPGGRSVEADGSCPIAEDRQLWGKNRGLYAGRICWRVLGTLCGGTIQDSYAEKMRDCAECDFFQQVRCEEGDRFER